MQRNHVPRYAAIDVGTNSIKFHIGERLSDGTWRTVIDRAEVVRLGEGLKETGMFSDQAMTRAAAAMSTMAEEAQYSGVDALVAAEILPVAHALSRDAAATIT